MQVRGATREVQMGITGRRAMRHVLLATAAMLVVAGCGGQAVPPSPPSGGATATADLAGQTITVYSGQHEQTAKLLTDALIRK